MQRTVIARLLIKVICGWRGIKGKSMFEGIKLQSYGPITQLDWQNLGPINLIIGENGAGKTFIMKAMYVSLKALSQYKLGDDTQSLRDKLLEKLKWTFEITKVGDLVQRGSSLPLECVAKISGKEFRYTFGADTERQIREIENHCSRPDSGCLFIPAKEVLSIQNIILRLRDQDQVYGFDETYVDLARALLIQTKKGNFHSDIKNAREQLDELIKGRVYLDEETSNWMFKKGKQNFSIREAAEGVRKIAIFETLLGNRSIGQNSIIFIDEPEAALHPRAIVRFLDIVSALTTIGVQFVISTHSYFVVKKLALIAKERKLSIPTLSLSRTDGEQLAQECAYSNLRDSFPDNPIIDEAIKLYEKEVEMSI